MAIQEHLQIAQVGIFVRHLIITCLILSIIIINTIVAHCPDGCFNGGICNSPGNCTCSGGWTGNDCTVRGNVICIILSRPIFFSNPDNSGSRVFEVHLFLCVVILPKAACNKGMSGLPDISTEAQE